MAVWCRGQAHDTRLGDRNEQEQRGNPLGVAYYDTEDTADIPPMVAINDQLEILIATGCTCADDHVRLRTFLTPPPQVPPIHLILPPANPFDPDSPSQQHGEPNDDTDP